MDMARKINSKLKMGATGINRLDTNNPFTPENARFADLITDQDLDEGIARYIEEKKTRVLKKSKGMREYPPPQETLDLHGETAVVAERKTVSFIHMSGAEGLKTVRIITGKGLHSPGGRAVLPDVVESQLAVLKHDGVIFNYVWEKKVKSKSGAVLVYF
jgi:DNA-nicking Smr family endonuclease